MSRRLALATCQAFPQLAEEDLPLLERLCAIGIDAQPAGAPRLVELELTEPSLFLAFADHAVDRIAEEIVSRL